MSKCNRCKGTISVPINSENTKIQKPLSREEISELVAKFMNSSEGKKIEKELLEWIDASFNNFEQKEDTTSTPLSLYDREDIIE